MENPTHWPTLAIILFTLLSTLACDQKSKAIRLQKKKIIQEYTEALEKIPIEILADPVKFKEYFNQDLKSLVPLVPIPEKSAKALINRLVNDPIRQLRLKKINGLHGDFSEINNCVNDISRNYTQYRDISKFTFYLGYILIDMPHAKKYVEELKNETPRTTYDNLLAKYKTDEKIAKKVYYNKQSVICHVGFKDTLLKDMHFQRPNGSHIRTIFNVGRLCPPKCPPEYYK